MPRHIPRPPRKKKRRSKKLPEHLRKHSFKRAMERYGIVFDENKRREVKKKIASGVSYEDCFCIERQSQTKTLWRVVIDEKVCGLVYNSRLSEIVTFIPEDDPRLQLAYAGGNAPKNDHPQDDKVKTRREHAATRAKQRYNIVFDEDKRQEVIEKIRSPALYPDCYCIGRLSKRRSYWRVIIDNTTCHLIYDSRHTDIITFVKEKEIAEIL